MKNKQMIFALLTMLFGFALTPNSARSQTPGTLTFSVTTTEPTGGYSGVHVIALWIEDTNGVFIKTKIRYGVNRVQYLDQWIASSNSNVVDATTGATLPSHGTLTFTWNGTNTSGTIVNDNTYKVWIQMSDRNLSGPVTSVSFVKDTNSHHITPANSGNFTNMVLDWNPSSGINEIERTQLDFRCEPNPFTDQTHIHYTLVRNSDVTITLHDAAGKTIAVLSDGEQKAGTHSLQLGSGQYGNLSAGTYYLRINTGFTISTQKLVLTR